MERDGFCYTCRVKPVFEQMLCTYLYGKFWEYAVVILGSTSFGKPLQGFLRQWQVNRCLCLVHDDMQAALTVVVCQLPPCDFPDVARTKSAVTPEEEGLLYIQVLAFRLF